MLTMPARLQHALRHCRRSRPARRAIRVHLHLGHEVSYALLCDPVTRQPLHTIEALKPDERGLRAEVAAWASPRNLTVLYDTPVSRS